MTITLRKRKLKKGRIKLYLDIYKGYTKSEDGKIHSIRDYEHLGLYLYEKANNHTKKQHNKQIDKLGNCKEIMIMFEPNLKNQI